MRHIVYSISYSAVRINFSLLTITLCYSARTTLIYNDTKYRLPCMTLMPNFTVNVVCGLGEDYVAPDSNLTACVLDSWGGGAFSRCKRGGA